MRKLMGVALVLSLAGCGSAVEEAHKAVAAQLENPASAKFTNVRTTPQGNVCGQVKGKDASGNYSGFQSYAAIRTEQGYQAIIDRDGSNVVVRAACGEPVTQAQAPAPATVDSTTGWDVRIADNNPGALSDMTSRLVEHGFMANVVNQNGKPRIFLGPFTSREEAEATRDKLMAGQGIESQVEPHPAP
ncbi:SPOR domain-containing protein [Pseudomonas japonica]|uniref:SPOR domain-containing protein n=1 Tax=Pseudomonas japonica TaxID=256466 RepID=UPI0015E2E914|nr:SPOR domain-containing protein [Pseudomonas japonica]MBA1243445.1 SPOR domain-containing protein [Pseudomonas japonica]MBA1290505.1 SPOR domain-containing protein [Pseudomonas japonica]